MHLVFHREGHLFCADWDMIAKLHPSVIVTLIDDVATVTTAYEVRGSRHSGEKHSTHERHCSGVPRRSRTLTRFVQGTCSWNPEALQILPTAFEASFANTSAAATVNILLWSEAPKHKPCIGCVLVSRFLHVLPHYTASRFRRRTQQEVDNFRQKLHSQFATLDPLVSGMSDAL